MNNSQHKFSGRNKVSAERTKQYCSCSILKYAVVDVVVFVLENKAYYMYFKWIFC